MTRNNLFTLLCIPMIVLTTFAFASDDVNTLINRVGNSEDDSQRHALLLQLARAENLDAETRRAVQQLVQIALDWWANDSYVPSDPTGSSPTHGSLAGWFVNEIELDRQLVPDVAEDSQLYPLCALYRGRMLLWQCIQMGHLRGILSVRDQWYGEGQRLLRTAAAAFPENRVIRMYLGEPVLDWPNKYPADPHAPAWANAQRLALEGLTDIIHWWIEYRQNDDGSYGGGWGDDVEMWRSWAPVMIGFQDARINAAQEKLSRGIFALERMRRGYTTTMTDVEHTSEDASDTITPMMHLKPEDPEWQARSLRLAELMRDVWTGINDRGFLQFKSTYFNVFGPDTVRQHACDTAMHTRALQPTLLHWQRIADSELTQLFTAWMDNWVDVAAREERGKPAGILPSAVRWPDGAAGGWGERWWQPENYMAGNLMYDWPQRTVYRLCCVLVQTYAITGDEKYLEPIRSMVAIRERYLDMESSNNQSPGSEAWCAEQLKTFLPALLAKYRQATGDRSFDALLEREATPYTRFVMQDDHEGLLHALQRASASLSRNWPAFTSENRWTDRVFAFDSYYLSVIQDNVPLPDTDLLYACVTGDPGSVEYLPLNAVRWLTPAREIAALVDAADTSRLSASIYHFGSDSRNVGAKLFLLKPGTYRISLQAEEGGQVILNRLHDIDNSSRTVRFELPPRQLCRLVVAIEREEKE